MVGAWASANRPVLGQVVDEEGDEIAALPAPLSLLPLKGRAAAIDAMGCQTAIARAIIGCEGGHIRALERDQGIRYREVAHRCADAHQTDFADYGHGVAETVDSGLGQVEIRRYRTIGDAVTAVHLDPDGGWPGCVPSAWRGQNGGKGGLAAERASS